MALIYNLNLPPIPQWIIDFSLKEIENIKHGIDNTDQYIYAESWGDADAAGRAHGINVANTQIRMFHPDSDVYKEINILYAGYFKKPMMMAWIVFSNQSDEHKFASLPPHCDINRTFTINYIIDPGGATVNTVLYKESRQLSDLTVPEFKNYNELSFDSEYCIPKNHWAIFEVQNYHSVEHIEGRRTMISMFSMDNYDRSFTEIFNEVSHLATPFDPVNLTK